MTNSQQTHEKIFDFTNLKKCKYEKTFLPIRQAEIPMKEHSMGEDEEKKHIFNIPTIRNTTVNWLVF